MPWQQGLVGRPSGARSGCQARSLDQNLAETLSSGASRTMCWVHCGYAGKIRLSRPARWFLRAQEKEHKKLSNVKLSCELDTGDPMGLSIPRPRRGNIVRTRLNMLSQSLRTSSCFFPPVKFQHSLYIDIKRRSHLCRICSSNLCI